MPPSGPKKRPRDVIAEKLKQKSIKDTMTENTDKFEAFVQQGTTRVSLALMLLGAGTVALASILQRFVAAQREGDMAHDVPIGAGGLMVVLAAWMFLARKSRRQVMISAHLIVVISFFGLLWGLGNVSRKLMYEHRPGRKRLIPIMVYGSPALFFLFSLLACVAHFLSVKRMKSKLGIANDKVKSS